MINMNQSLLQILQLPCDSHAFMIAIIPTSPRHCSSCRGGSFVNSAISAIKSRRDFCGDTCIPGIGGGGGGGGGGVLEYSLRFDCDESPPIACIANGEPGGVRGPRRSTEPNDELRLAYGTCGGVRVMRNASGYSPPGGVRGPP
jgi:hypothetical protein